MPRRRASWYRSALTARPSPLSSQSATKRPRRAATTARTTTSSELSDDEDPAEEDTEERPPSLRLTVKMPSSRLREVTSATPKDVAPMTSTRSTRNIKKSYVVESSSEEEEEEEEEQEDYAEEDEIAEDARPNADQVGEDEDEDGEEADEDDNEAEIDADGDIEMGDDADDGVPLGHRPPPPILRVNPPAAPKGKPTITVKAAPKPTKLKSVEAKEMSINDADDDDDDDEELSELGSDDDEEEEDEEAEEDDEDAEAEDDAEGEDMENDEDDEGDDSRSPDLLSRGTTPDINKMTKRQRSRLNEVYTASTSPTSGGGGSAFLELPMEPQIKKHLTAEEHAMRRAEMARRRKNLSEKRNEEEKQDTINRLLKKQAPKRRGKISAKEIEAQDRGDMSEAEEQQLLQRGNEEAAEIVPANPVFVRWVSDRQGCRVGVPAEWEGTPMGQVFVGGSNAGGSVSGKMVEEVEG